MSIRDVLFHVHASACGLFDPPPPLSHPWPGDKQLIKRSCTSWALRNYVKSEDTPSSACPLCGELKIEPLCISLISIKVGFRYLIWMSVSIWDAFHQKMHYQFTEWANWLERERGDGWWRHCYSSFCCDDSNKRGTWQCEMCGKRVCRLHWHFWESCRNRKWILYVQQLVKLLQLAVLLCYAKDPPKRITYLYIILTERI